MSLSLFGDVTLGSPLANCHASQQTHSVGLSPCPSSLCPSLCPFICLCAFSLLIFSYFPTLCPSIDFIYLNSHVKNINLLSTALLALSSLLFCLLLLLLVLLLLLQSSDNHFFAELQLQPSFASWCDLRPLCGINVGAAAHKSSSCNLQRVAELAAHNALPASGLPPCR